MSSFFITATGTDIGKTFTVCQLIKQLRQKNKTVDAIKPIASGFDLNDASSDTHRIIEALGQPMTEDVIAQISSWRFSAPLSPDMAAVAENQRIDLHEVVDLCKQRIKQAKEDYFFIEGVGGIMVPLNEHAAILTLIKALGIPTIVVAGTYLGSLNHTLLTLAQLKHERIQIAGLVVSESEGDTPGLAETMASLSHFTDVPMIALPRIEEGSEVPDLTLLVEHELGELIA